ncbi:hypothetical protein [Saprospira grandis]|uniref:Uncharacterized protein n=2 Tax=Saprospira grandis TaxID=1008 RepID=H6LA73_SAPGL|nr:hypothetical protein [Saprospira grandis]AFC25541.1 hypothetical protein SGRA_2813 [Saprospira grandis str. Lewin]EJF53891.1 hypothetical protein SapgrDRAFT_2215 [Saprospira grandis DSM 2844]WBM73562.1 hypothetical protein OP864_11265 [Saprospira grandis]
MQLSQFYSSLLGVSAFVAASLLGLQWFWPRFANYGGLAWASYLFFVLFSWLCFFWARQASQSPDQLQFSRVFMMQTSIKMLLSLSLVLAYFYTFKPADQLFVLPFFWVYFCFTLFEIYFLTQLGKA